MADKNETLEKNETKALDIHVVTNQRELLIAFMEHYRDNDGMCKRDNEAIDCFLKSN